MAVAALSRIGDVTRNTLSGSTVEARVTDIARRRLNEDIIQQFRSGGGQVGGQFARTPLLLLTTTGARSGESRTWPLAYQRDGDRVVVSSSSGVRGTRPGWYHNLLAHPDARVEVGTESWASPPRS
ncbi:F420H(2)-dependent quinone reductase [Nocardia seriolae]|uniref:F420H(2)-dependent quinone reductase n=1 Tax=Nocardia seriolae TaxID=37332 RepID=A0ABC8AVN9_9NOCA|nr:F420H(2)-dependent quinone reductase [Nocardia seriolae]